MDGPIVEIILTAYRIRLDRATVELLTGFPFPWPSTVIPGCLSDVGLEYAVHYGKDNEYVHKAVRKSLRQAIKDAKALKE